MIHNTATFNERLYSHEERLHTMIAGDPIAAYYGRPDIAQEIFDSEVAAAEVEAHTLDAVRQLSARVALKPVQPELPKLVAVAGNQ